MSKYGPIVSKLKKGAEADKLKKVATNLDKSRENLKKSPMKAVPIHLGNLKKSEKEVQAILKSIDKKDKETMKVATQFASEIANSKSMLSKVNPKQMIVRK